MSLLRLNAAFSSLGLRLESALCSSSAMLSERRSRISHVQRIHRKLLSLRDVQNVTRWQCSDVYKNTNFKQVDSGVPAPNHTKKAPAARLSGKRGSRTKIGAIYNVSSSFLALLIYYLDEKATNV